MGDGGRLRRPAKTQACLLSNTEGLTIPGIPGRRVGQEPNIVSMNNLSRIEDVAVNRLDFGKPIPDVSGEDCELSCLGKGQNQRAPRAFNKRKLNGRLGRSSVAQLRRAIV